MAQIVSIDTGTKRDINNLGDIVFIHEDDVELTSNGYDGFKIIQVHGMSRAKLKQSLAIEKEDRVSKYAYNLALSKTDTDNLKKPTTNEADKITILKKITVNN